MGIRKTGEKGKDFAWRRKATKSNERVILRNVTCGRISAPTREVCTSRIETAKNSRGKLPGLAVQLSQWQCYDEGASLFELAFDFNIAAVGLGDGEGKGQTESGTRFFPSRSSVTMEEFFKNSGQVLLGDAVP